MRLKHLELQGYKTFAAKTEFIFNGGLTAIIGPNGSGKSNVADAIQWVLGEQSYALLRAKRSEDMIFSGSNERSRMGMAQASLTLDNSDGWLPIDYGEVVLTRRAYRSGENEYLINGSRVRLRDMTDLLGHSGLAKRTYTFIGQGLVDQALSLRPGERRALIEEAAGIAGHQARRNTAQRQLDETRHNLERVRDILGEIEPRLRYLKGQATRAEQRLHVQADLDARLRLWYGFRWRQALAELARAQAAEAEARGRVESRQAELDELLRTANSLRERHAEIRSQLGDWHRESSQLHRRAELVQRELAVGAERLRQFGERRDDLVRELAPLREQEQAQQTRVQAAEADLEAAQAELATLAAAVREAQARLDAVEDKRRRQDRQVEQARRHALALERQSISHEQRLLEQQGRQRALAEEIEQLLGHLAQAQASQQDVAARLARSQGDQAGLEDRGQELANRRQALREALQGDEARLAQLTAEHARLRRSADRLRDRLDLLRRLKEEGEGYSGGARAVIRARGQLPGIRGVVADQLRVPAELELAIETALGGRLHDVVVETWPQAEAAIAWLKREDGGRATFLPLDTLRPGRRLDVPAGPGVVGLAADLVGYEPGLETLVDYLLGRIVVARDLPSARRAFERPGERPTVVTLDGDILRPGGSVSGGSQARRHDQGALARERELRELPEALAAAEREAGEGAEAVAAAEQELAARREELARLDASLAGLALEQQAAAAALALLQGEMAREGQELTWRENRLSAARVELGDLQQKAGQAEGELATLADQIEAARQAVAEAEQAAAGVDATVLIAALAEQRTAAGVVGARVGNLQSTLAVEQRALTQNEREIRHRQERTASLAAEQEALAARMETWRADEAVLAAEIERFAQLIDPGEGELAHLETERLRIAAVDAEQRRHMQVEERAYSQAQLAAQRARDELAHLRGEIEHDVGLVELEPGDGLNDQLTLPLRPLVERLPEVDELPEGLEEEIRELRGQYHRLGGVNPNAPEEYAEALERFEFLTSQSADLEEAAGTLEGVIDELNQVMEREFTATFKAVASEFKQQFTTLFGGGTARLQLSDPDEGLESGIEIVVRPPGKRTQPLPLLSGGERSLTAAALILSILKVSPPPFCVLDEVDAALDEANVDRFRAALREAAQDTQFIVITHNRGTIEVADTIYGVSMGADSASQVLSLQLEERDGVRELVPA